MSVALAVQAAGACILCWFTGYGMGRLKRTVIRLMSKGAR